MSGVLRSFVDRIMGGRGEHSITVPVMDGALKPNDYLDRMPVLAALEAADNLVSDGAVAHLSSGASLYRLDADATLTLLGRETADITFLALSPAGALAIGLDSGGIRILGGPHDGKTFGTAGTGRINAPTAAVFADDDTLVVCNGSAVHPASEWRRDLLSLGRTGSVAKLDLAGGATRVLADHLAWPSGICLAGKGAAVVSEAWRHRLLRLRLDGGAVDAVLADLPAYPGRLTPASGGGSWLTLFAVRSQLQEFVLREPRYRREMMTTVEPAYWIAPALSSGKSFKEPLQAGGVIRLGIHKPWAPTRSYGLVARLDEQFQPSWSAHSRANGSRHGITSIAELGGRAVVTARGNDELLAIDHTAIEEPLDLFILAEAAE
jgi:hypothetical protein